MDTSIYWCIEVSIHILFPLVNGGYSEWSNWTACSVTCGTGLRYRGRVCDNPEPQNGGLDCSEQPQLGNDTEAQQWVMQNCPGKRDILLLNRALCIHDVTTFSLTLVEIIILYINLLSDSLQSKWVRMNDSYLIAYSFPQRMDYEIKCRLHLACMPDID